MESPADDDLSGLVRNIHGEVTDIQTIPDEPVFRVYKRRWYMLGVVCVLNISNAMVRKNYFSS